MADFKEQRAKALKLIERAAYTRAKDLRLGGMGLTELPPEIGILTNLTDLDVGGNQLAERVEHVFRLALLQDARSPAIRDDIPGPGMFHGLHSD